MSLQNRLQALRERHHELDELIRQEQARPSADDLEIAELKRQKLKLKDEIVELERSGEGA